MTDTFVMLPRRPVFSGFNVKLYFDQFIIVFIAAQWLKVSGFLSDRMKRRKGY